MKVYSLTGKSGTGKSFQAQSICIDRDIDLMVDDGLLISPEGALAGESAKRQKTRIGAIKTAIFEDDSRAEEVREKIKEICPKSILILATSDRMADIIARRLNLPKVEERIYIEDVTTPAERKAAEKQRDQQGKHVIPVPTLQLKRDFAGYFMDPMRLIRKAKGATGMAQETIDTFMQQGLSMIVGGKDKSFAAGRTVVRPTYSYMGDFIIADSVVTDIADCVQKEVPGVEEVLGIYENTAPDELKVFAVIKVSKDRSIYETAEKYQTRLAEVIETMTAFNVVQVDIEVKEVV